MRVSITGFTPPPPPPHLGMVLLRDCGISWVSSLMSLLINILQETIRYN